MSKDHPMRRTKEMADAALARLSPTFDRMYARGPSLGAAGAAVEGLAVGRVGGRQGGPSRCGTPELGQWPATRPTPDLGGRASVRRILYMAIMTAICHNPPIRAFYRRLCAQGKPRKVALVAARRKQASWNNEYLLKVLSN